MSKPDTWMPFFVGDYLGDTQRLTTEQHGAYLLLILDYWRNGPPPNDDTVLAQITRLERKAWSKHKAALLSFFRVKNGKLTHKRIDEELERASEMSLKARERARKGAEARWSKQENGQESLPLDDARSNASSMLQAISEHAPARVDAPSPSPSPPQEESPTNQPTSSDPRSKALLRVLSAAGIAPTPMALAAAQPVLVGWLDSEHDLEKDVLPGIATALKEKPGRTSSLKRFTSTIERTKAERIERAGRSLRYRAPPQEPEAPAEEPLTEEQRKALAAEMAALRKSLTVSDPAARHAGTAPKRVRASGRGA